MSTRPAAPGDGEFLADLYASTRSDELARVPWSASEKRAFLRKQFEAQTAHYEQAFPRASRDIILSDGRPVGRLYLDRRPAEIRVVDIALLPSHRGLGIGARLLAGVLDEARATGQCVRIHVEHANPARHLYLRLGFRPVHDQGVYQLMQWGESCSSN